MFKPKALAFALLFASNLSFKIAFVTTFAGTVVLSQSSTSTVITAPGTSRNATASPNNIPANIAAAPSAIRIWDGPGINDPTCNMNITVQDTFTLRCLNLPLTVYIGVDNKFTATFMGTLFSSNTSVYAASAYTFSTTGVACSNTVLYIRLKPDFDNRRPERPDSRRDLPDQQSCLDLRSNFW